MIHSFIYSLLLLLLMMMMSKGQLTNHDHLV